METLPNLTHICDTHYSFDTCCEEKAFCARKVVTRKTKVIT